MKRRYIPIEDALRQARAEYEHLTSSDGICACYDIEDMGFCKDGTTRWYHFTSVEGDPAYTLKR